MMTQKETSPKRFSHRNKRAVSSVITTIIISSILLIILMIAAFVSTNILTVQMASAEFEQAQTNMLLLDSVIQDISLRPSAGGYVQFNEREGGIGTATTTNSLSITIPGAAQPIVFNNLLHLVYRGGSHASAAVDPSTGYTSLRGTPDSAYVGLTQGLGFVNLTQDNGAKIILDYDRVRIVSTGLMDSDGTNLIQITFINLIKGEISPGSGIVNVMVQNVNTTSYPPITSPGASISITVQHSALPSQVWQVAPPPGTTRNVVVFTEIQIEISLK